jgi:hypothetical protein
MSFVPKGPPARASAPGPGLVHRRTMLQLLGVAALAIGCRSERKRDAHLIRPETTGSLEPDVLAALLATGTLISEFVGFRDHVPVESMTSNLQLKCSEPPSYLSTYQDYSSRVVLPEALTDEWLAGLDELHRVSVVGEIAVLLLISGGFRAFGYANFNGYMGGLWHRPHESKSFRASDDT